MATSTSNLGLTLPSVNDAADIAVLNSNFQKIDGKIPSVGAAPDTIVHKELKVASEAELDTALTAEVNTMWNNSVRFLVISPSSIAMFGGIGMLCELYLRSNSGYATATFTGYGQYTPEIMHKTMWAGTWQPLEYANPPMQLGVEYRTTKRCEGKPVYAKRISLGALPNNSEKTVSYDIIGYTPVSHEETFVSTSGWKLCTYPDIVVIPNGDGYCTVKTTADFSKYTGYTTLEYVYD